MIFKNANIVIWAVLETEIARKTGPTQSSNIVIEKALS